MNDYIYVHTAYALSLLLLFQLFPSISSYQGPSNRLTRHLLAQHQSSAPPDGKVVVEHEIELVHIINIDELKQHMEVLVYIEEKWNDSSLSWEPASFENISKTWLPEEAMWVPDLIVFNMLEHKELLHSVRSPIKVHADGSVVFSYPAIYTLMCPIKISRFPFDEQSCELQIASWGYSEDKILLSALHKPSLKHYSLNEEWALQKVDVRLEHYDHEGITVSELRYIIAVVRKPFYYLVSLVLPSYLICALSIAGLFARFSTRHERQERFTLGVTAILSMAVLSLVVTEKVPHSSEDVPLLIVYFHFIVVMVTIATILTSSVMRVHAKGFDGEFKSPPVWVQRILFVSDRKANFEEDPHGSLVLKIHTAAEQWSEVARRMDYLLAGIFILVISTPTSYLFYMCLTVDYTSAERALLSGQK